MNDPDAEPMSNEELLQHTRELRDKLKPHANQWREIGFEVAKIKSPHPNPLPSDGRGNGH